MVSVGLTAPMTVSLPAPVLTMSVPAPRTTVSAPVPVMMLPPTEAAVTLKLPLAEAAEKFSKSL